MKITIPFLGLLGAALVFTAEGADRETLTKSFDVKRGGKLVMNVDRGSIRVTSSATDKVEVKVAREVRGASGAAAQKVYDQHKIEMKQEGDTVSVTVDRPSGKSFLFSNPFNKLRVEYTIGVPAEFNLDLHTSGGNIDVNALKGEVKVHTSGGNLTLGAVDGPVRAETSGGNISVECGNGVAFVRTSGGDITLREMRGEVTAKTSGGNISIEQVDGPVRAETSGGNIKVKESQGAVYARTSGGNVSAQLARQPSADCTLTTSGGNVSLTIPAQAAVDVSAKTSGGSIRSDFPGEMNKNRTKLAAQINGGGPDIMLETSGGDVELRRR
jgi:DUF4097 and DUF4098 domain-containing protein YvlB